MRRNAFTLLELLVVLAILATLFGLGISTYQRQFARSRFKNGVVELQIDLHRTRLLAMNSGTPYLFRYVPGSGIYEIAPVKTLQEAIYRSSGENIDAFGDGSVALGGSLSLPGGSTSDGVAANVGNSGLYAQSDPGAFGAIPATYSDDLFSAANISADLAASRPSGGVAFGSGFDAVNSSGGSNGFSSEIPNGDLSGTLSNGFVDSASGFSTSGNDALGTGGTFGLDFGAADGLGDFAANSTTLRDLNVQEKGLATATTLVWRVNADGAIIRKELSGDAIFTFGRVSLSTPNNLRSRRPTGVAPTSSSDAPIAESPESDFGSTLTGSLTQTPGADPTFGESELGGDLNNLGEIEGTPDPVASSLWSEPIVFYPNGRTSTAVLGLACVGDYSFYSEIAIRGMTGVARISSISALAPGVDPTASALTQEQLFRLSNPGATAQSADSTESAFGDSAQTTLSGGSLGAVDDGLGAFENVENANIFSGLNETDDLGGLDGGSNDPSARRSGYRFDSASPPQNALLPQNASPPQSVSLPQNASALQVAPPSNFDALSQSALDSQIAPNAESEKKDPASLFPDASSDGGAL